MKACVFTLGCKVNRCESDSIITALKKRQIEVADTLCYADFYIVNTCAVTNEAESKSRQSLARIKALNDNAKIFVIGCASQNNADKFIKDENVVYVGGTYNKGGVIDAINCYLDNKLFEKENIADNEQFFNDLPFTSTLRTRTNIKIEDGCNNFCSYCLIPYLRGRNRSRSPESIINEIKSVKTLEVCLDGINTSAYKYGETDLTGLIMLLKDFDVRIRLGSLEVNVITEEFLQALKSLKDFAPHFHLSLQSGSDKVLKDMNRHYTTEQFYKKVLLIKKYLPYSAITTDVICGYPTESEEDFNKTLEFVKKVNFSEVHAFTFSMRSGTVASKLKDLPKSVKKERTNKLIKVASELYSDFCKNNLHRELSVIGEVYENGYTVGYSENYIKVYVKGDYTDKKYKVKTINCCKDGIMGDIIKK